MVRNYLLLKNKKISNNSYCKSRRENVFRKKQCFLFTNDYELNYESSFIQNLNYISLAILSNLTLSLLP